MPYQMLSARLATDCATPSTMKEQNEVTPIVAARQDEVRAELSAGRAAVERTER